MTDAAPTAVRAWPRATRLERTWLWLHRNLEKWGTPLALWVYRRMRGGVAGRLKVDVLLLTTRGRRSGKRRTVMLQHFPDGEAMLVTAANGGGCGYPGWYHNLTADPDAQVEVGSRVRSVRAEELPAAEAAEWWIRIVRRDPNYVLYRRATSRPLPVVRLVPCSEADGQAPAASG